MVALFQDYLETPPQDFHTPTTNDQQDERRVCFRDGARGVRYREGVWTIHLAGIGCKGLEVYTVDDLTGQVNALAPTLTASTSLTAGPVSLTPTPEETPTPDLTPAPGPIPAPEADPKPQPPLNLGLPLTPGPALSPRATPNPEYAKVVSLIALHLTKSGELNASCIDTARIEAKKGFLPSAATTGLYWTVKAESDFEAQTTWGCPQLHYYEVNDFTGEVRRTRGQ